MNHKYTIPQVQFSLAFKDTTKTSIIKAFSLPHQGYSQNYMFIICQNHFIYVQYLDSCDTRKLHKILVFLWYLPILSGCCTVQYNTLQNIFISSRRVKTQFSHMLQWSHEKYQLLKGPMIAIMGL